jgi:hypothetical protein
MTDQNNQKPNFYSLYQKVGNIEGKLDTALVELQNHQNRLNTVERTQDQIVGKISIIGAIFGFIGGIITTIMATFIRK